MVGKTHIFRRSARKTEEIPYSISNRARSPAFSSDSTSSRSESSVAHAAFRKAARSAAGTSMARCQRSVTCAQRSGVIKPRFAQIRGRARPGRLPNRASPSQASSPTLVPSLRSTLLVQGHGDPTSSAFRGNLPPRMIDQDAPHELRRDGKEMNPVVPAYRGVPHQSQIGLMHERRALQRVIRTLLPQTISRDAPKFLVDQGGPVPPERCFHLPSSGQAVR